MHRQNIHRRTFLAGVGAAALLPRSALAQTTAMPRLKAMVNNVQLAPPNFAPTEIWGYGGQMPGTEIRVKQGARVQRRLHNALPQATSVHWHGLRSDNAMDGVAGLTQDPVQPGQGFDYDFAAPDAGTYWYHSHNRSAEQVARGLYGALIVEEPDPLDIDREEVLILDDWLLNPETAQIDPDFTSSHDRSHAGRRGNYIATNGQFELTRPAARHERLRLRIINAANARLFRLGLAGLEGWVVAIDGMPVPAPTPMEDTMLLGPGQRVDLIVDVTAEPGEKAYLVRIDDDQPFAQVTFPVTNGGTRARRAPPPALPPNPDQVVEGLQDALRTKLNMAGGAMGSLDAAVLKGERKSFRQLADANEFWAFNGVVGMTDTPLLNASLGQTVRVEVFNDTAFPHAMHLHGNHFREILADGSLGLLRDTLLTFGGDKREIAFVANNPGDWLFHCHMLSHAESGMMTWVKVS
jgi:FtsP/CotA-like multicopper oxidase with cupredoxin domain